ncbi:hypothetical protein ACOMHN_009257 [Nucella lapillus]
MGLKDSLVMSAVPAHDVIKPRAPPTSAMPTTSAIEGGRTLALEETFQVLAVGSGDISQQENNNLHKNEVANSNSEKTNNENDIGQGDGDDIIYQYSQFSDDADSDSDDLKLSKALHSWMSGYVIKPLPRQAHTVRQPVFSAQLGRESNIRRAESTESVNTQLSLFSCSSHGSRKYREKKRRRLRRRKTICAETAEELNAKPSSAPSAGSQGSRWVELAKKRKGELDRFMRAQSHALSQGFNLLDESEAFQLCAPDERRALYLCGLRDKMALVGMKKSSSLTNVCADIKAEKKPRVASAGAKTFFGKPLDFQELRRQMINKRLSALGSFHRARSSGRGRSLHRSLSRTSLTSAASSSDMFFSTTTPLNLSPPASESGWGVMGGTRGRVEAARRASVFVMDKDVMEKTVSMWKGDSEILAIDLKRELTTKVKRRIATTATALERVTGLGDDNEQKADYTCHLSEFPAYVAQDYGMRPKIPQKIRISPQLSEVIKSDIRVRMGRPRYHEIREQDLEQWNRGQTLDRAHRNLKVFNWLHSLKEGEFNEAEALRQRINDVPPDERDLTFGDMVLIRAVDDPDVKPLFQHSENKKTFVRL